MIDFFFSLPLWVQAAAKGLVAALVIIPIAGGCSLAERKISAWIQGRPGPNRALPFWGSWIPVLGPILQRLGVFHMMADGGKLFFKEDIVPGHVNKVYYYLAPALGLVPALTTIVVVPFGAYFDAAAHAMKPLILADVNIGLLAVFAVSSLGVYSLILAGWASNSKYPFLGGIRASAQLISYELSMTLSVLPVFLWVNAPGTDGTLSLFAVVQSQSQPGLFGGMWYVMLMPVSALIFLIALFAETNRQPFDMAEGEADLVGGFHTEYGEFKWSMFFVNEYAHMTIGSGIFVLLFLGGWNPLPWVPLQLVVSTLPVWLGGLIGVGIFLAKVFFFIFFFMWVRWTIPRFRYDQVMSLGWRKLLPLSIANLLFYALVIAFLDTRG